jgi:copper chaperone CopZ
MAKLQAIEVPVAGMDCTECTQHVHKAVKAPPAVESVNAFFSSEKAVITMDPNQVGMPAIRKAVEMAGYKVPGATDAQAAPGAEATESSFTRQILTLGRAAGIQSHPRLWRSGSGRGAGGCGRQRQACPWS